MVIPRKSESVTIPASRSGVCRKARQVIGINNKKFKVILTALHHCNYTQFSRVCSAVFSFLHHQHQLSHVYNYHCKKGFVMLTIIFFTRVATVDMVLWEDTRIFPCDSQLWAIQCTWSSYRNNRICYTSAGKIFLTSDKCYMQQKGIVPSQRSLSCELQYTNYLHSISKFPSPCSNFNCCSIQLLWSQGMT